MTTKKLALSNNNDAVDEKVERQSDGDDLSSDIRPQNDSSDSSTENIECMEPPDGGAQVRIKG